MKKKRNYNEKEKLICRELAIQIAEQFDALGSGFGAKSVVVSIWLYTLPC
jgi:hypothetical protein